MSKNSLILRVKIKFYIFPSKYENDVNDYLYNIFCGQITNLVIRLLTLYYKFFIIFLVERRFKMTKFNVKRVGELLDNEGLWLNQCGNLFSVPGFGEIVDVRYDCPEEEVGCVITFADGFEMDFDE